MVNCISVHRGRRGGRHVYTGGGEFADRGAGCAGTVSLLSVSTALRLTLPRPHLDGPWSSQAHKAAWPFSQCTFSALGADS
jgi:hypothetical protein